MATVRLRNSRVLVIAELRVAIKTASANFGADWELAGSDE